MHNTLRGLVDFPVDHSEWEREATKEKEKCTGTM